MKTILVSAFSIYFTVGFLLYFLQRQFLYFPQKAFPVAEVNTIRFDFDEITLQGWVLHEDRQKALIYYGGNAENIEMNVDFFKENLQDIAIYLIPYRGYGENSGSPTEKDLYQDALQIFDFIKNRHKEVVLMGRSLGSGIATYVASQREISSMILVTPYDSIENVAKEMYWIFPISFLLKDRYKSIDRVGDIKSPVLLLIASEDRVIRRKHSENLRSYFNPSLVTSVVINGAGHNNIHLYGEYSASIQNFLSSSPLVKEPDE